MSKIDVTNDTSSKKIYPKCSNGHVDFTLNNSAHKTIAQCPKGVEMFQVLEKFYFSQKCSQDHVQCSFHNPADKFFPGGRKFFAHCPKFMEWKIFPKRFVNFFQNASMIFCTCGLHIYSLVKNFVTEGRNLSAQYPKTKKIRNLLQQTFSTQKDPMITYNGILTNSSQNVVEEAKNFCPKEQKDKLNNFF